MQVLDATLKEITSALLESDVNVKLVSQLRSKVKTKVKAALDGGADKSVKEVNRKNVVQKVRSARLRRRCRTYLTSPACTPHRRSSTS